jgi:hypothetical protein
MLPGSPAGDGRVLVHHAMAAQHDERRGLAGWGGDDLELPFGRSFLRLWKEVELGAWRSWERV